MRLTSLLRATCGLLLIASASLGLSSCEKTCASPKNAKKDCKTSTDSTTTKTTGSGNNGNT